MDRLRSQDGCPWDARQTHESLSEYLLEETYETLAAIEHGDTADLVEELGDLLLQVVFHARLGQEESPSWDIDDVANGISDKLIRRHPHVFASPAEVVQTEDSLEMDSPDPRSSGQSAVDPEGTGQTPAGPEALSRNWTRAKAAEKGRSSALDGIPQAMPALAQAQKTWRRAVESGLSPALPEISARPETLTRAEASSSTGVTTRPVAPATSESSDSRPSPTLTETSVALENPTDVEKSVALEVPVAPEKQPLIEAPAQPDSQEQLGGALMGLVVAAERSGLDAEAALRAAITKMRLEIRELESPAQPGQPPPERAG